MQLGKNVSKGMSVGSTRPNQEKGNQFLNVNPKLGPNRQPFLLTPRLDSTWGGGREQKSTIIHLQQKTSLIFKLSSDRYSVGNSLIVNLACFRISWSEIGQWIYRM